jgi:hypothetical protein
LARPDPRCQHDLALDQFLILIMWHVHTVVSAIDKKPELVLNAFKANATRQLRQAGLWPHAFSPWADKGSKRRLWNERSVEKAIDYVVNGQGEDVPDFDD